MRSSKAAKLHERGNAGTMRVPFLINRNSKVMTAPRLQGTNHDDGHGLQNDRGGNPTRMHEKGTGTLTLTVMLIAYSLISTLNLRTTTWSRQPSRTDREDSSGHFSAARKRLRATVTGYRNRLPFIGCSGLIRPYEFHKHLTPVCNNMSIGPVSSGLPRRRRGSARSLPTRGLSDTPGTPSRSYHPENRPSRCSHIPASAP
jgi:hypothetical protein